MTVPVQLRPLKVAPRVSVTAGMACLFFRQGPGGKVKGGSPCNGISESDNVKGGVASNYLKFKLFI